MKSKRLLLLVMAICLASGVNAQLYSNDVCYYVPRETVITDNTEICMVYFAGDRILMESKSCAQILTEPSSYWYNKLKKMYEETKNGYKYDSSLSSSSNIVYKASRSNLVTFSQDGFWYRSFPKDKSTMTLWGENKNGQKVEETAYKLVNRADLVPVRGGQPGPQPQRNPQPMNVWRQCFGCNGSGQCSHCYGQGWTVTSRTYDGKTRCISCSGNGKCPICAGQGGHYEVEYR